MTLIFPLQTTPYKQFNTVQFEKLGYVYADCCGFHGLGEGIKTDNEMFSCPYQFGSNKFDYNVCL